MGHRIGVVKHKENPFLVENTVSTRKRRTVVGGKGMAIVNTETGEVETAVEIVRVTTVDTEQFVKVFTQNLRVFFDLSSITIKLLEVLLSQVQKAPNTDKVMLNVSIAQDYFTETSREPISKASFHRAIKEMLDKNFVAETQLSGLFFINPNLFFNGDRVRFVTELQRKKANEDHAEVVSRMQARGQIGSAGEPLAISDDSAHAD